MYRRDSLAVLSAIDDAADQKTALDDEGSWPHWMTKKSLFIFTPEHAWRKDATAIIAYKWYSCMCGIVVAIGILGVFMTPQAQLTNVTSTTKVGDCSLPMMRKIGVDIGCRF